MLLVGRINQNEAVEHKRRNKSTLLRLARNHIQFVILGAVVLLVYPCGDGKAQVIAALALSRQFAFKSDLGAICASRTIQTVSAARSLFESPPWQQDRS